MIRTAMLALFGGGTLLFATIATPEPAGASPGMVNARGCHSSHCHSRGELRRNTRGRYYVPGHFDRRAKKHRRHAHRRRR